MIVTTQSGITFVLTKVLQSSWQVAIFAELIILDQEVCGPKARPLLSFRQPRLAMLLAIIENGVLDDHPFKIMKLDDQKMRIWSLHFEYFSWSGVILISLNYFLQRKFLTGCDESRCCVQT